MPILVEVPSIAIDIDAAARTVVVSEASFDLQQIGIVVGTVITVIDDRPAYDFIAAADARDERILTRVPIYWTFAVRERTIRLLLIKEEAAIEQAPVGDTAEATSSDFDALQFGASGEPDAPASDAGIPHNTTEAPSADFDDRFEPWRDPRPVFAYLPEYPVGDRHHQRERPPRKVSVEYIGSWGQNMGPTIENDGRSFTLPKQRAPLYDR